MASCDGCGKETRGGDWTCGHCGAPLARAGAAAGSGAGLSGYAPSYEPPAAYVAPASYGAPAAPPAAKGGLSRSTFTVIIVAAVEGTPVSGSGAAQASGSTVVLVKDD